MTAGVEGVGMEMDQKGAWECSGLDSGGINEFQQVTCETIAGKPKLLVPLARRSLEDEQPVPPCDISVLRLNEVNA
jgi:hypothetical protein